jgi:hypothetical protein
VAHRIGEHDVKALTESYAVDTQVDVVVFSAPQLSLFELRSIAALCEGRRFQRPLLAVTSPQVKPDADRFGYTDAIEAAGGTVLAGMCFYQSYAREIADAKGCTPGQLALAWVLAQGDDVAPIPGTKRVKYLEENVAAAAVELTTEDLAALEEAVPRDAVVGDRYGDMSHIDQ